MKMMLIVAMATASLGLSAASAQTSTQAPARSAQDLYTAKCSHCHGANGWGTRTLAKRMDPSVAELVKREGMPAAYVKYVVRRGIGSMPQFTATDLSNDELDRLAAWLEAKK